MSARGDRRLGRVGALEHAESQHLPGVSGIHGISKLLEQVLRVGPTRWHPYLQARDGRMLRQRRLNKFHMPGHLILDELLHELERDLPKRCGMRLRSCGIRQMNRRQCLREA